MKKNKIFNNFFNAKKLKKKYYNYNIKKKNHFL